MSESNANPLEPFIDAIAEAVAQRLQAQQTPGSNDVTERPYLTAHEAADLLRLSKSAVRSLIRTRKLKFYKLGRRVILKRADLERFMEANTREPKASLLRSS